ncbi:MAG: hypothetical protein RIS92_2701 [Verrucomicrobiota bacterium]
MGGASGSCRRAASLIQDSMVEPVSLPPRRMETGSGSARCTIPMGTLLFWWSVLANRYGSAGRVLTDSRSGEIHVPCRVDAGSSAGAGFARKMRMFGNCFALISVRDGRESLISRAKVASPAQTHTSPTWTSRTVIWEAALTDNSPLALGCRGVRVTRHVPLVPAVVT